MPRPSGTVGGQHAGGDRSRERAFAIDGHAGRVLPRGGTVWPLALGAGGGDMPSPVADVYRRPYEGTDVDPVAMQVYLDWEHGLVAQLGRDGTHGFTVLTPERRPARTEANDLERTTPVCGYGS
jgi:hypothetical protein